MKTAIRLITMVVVRFSTTSWSAGDSRVHWGDLE